MELELFVTALHVVLCVLMVLIILLQPGKGGDVGAAFGGGGGSTVFGPRGSAGLLARATTVVAVMFMVTSVVLSKGSGRTDGTAASAEDEQEVLERLQSGADASGNDVEAPAADDEPPAEQPAE